jgi:cation:H+ antiporter
MDSILISAIFTALLVIFAAVLLGWASEALEKFIAPGLALALLAFLQTLPEYTVEAIIAWSRNTHLMVANLTGSLRLLLGFGWPMIFIIAAVTHWFRTKKLLTKLELNPHQSLETLFLIPAVVYFTFIWLKKTMTPVDGVILILMFLVFIKVISKAKVGDADEVENSDMPRVVKKIVRLPAKKRNASIIALFAVGGIAILLVAHPFVESLKALAVSLGVSEFLFIQWVAPFISEFPEKTTAFIWASRPKKATTGMMNMVSSNLNQWMLLAGSLPLVFSISSGAYSTIIFDAFQCEEIILTILQTAMVLACMWDAKVTWWEVLLIFGLWIIGFFFPHERSHMIYVHLAAFIIIIIGSFIMQPVPEIWKRARVAIPKR